MDSATDNIKKQVALKITHQLYLHSSVAIFSSILNVLIVTVVFHNVADTVVLYTWATITILYLCMRLFFCRYVLKKGITLDDHRRRLKQFTVTIFISGVLLGSTGVLFLSVDTPTYNSFIFFLMGGIFAGSAGILSIQQRIFYLFAAPVILPVIIYSCMLGGSINNAMSLMGFIFSVMMISVVRRMNESMIEAFTLSMENKVLAEKTRLLNEKLKLSNAKFKTLSFKDTMTNAYNRRYIGEILNPEIDRFAFSLLQSLDSDNEKLLYGIYIIDIDHFKVVNDTWGHKSGDDMLIQFVHALQSLIRKEDILCRWGGEEFVIILKRTDPNYVQKFAQKIIDKIHSTKFKMNDSTQIHKNCSIGYAQFPFFDALPVALTLDQTIEIADQALYHAKENGRDKAIFAAYNTVQNNINSKEAAQLMMQDISKYLQCNDITLTDNSVVSPTGDNLESH